MLHIDWDANSPLQGWSKGPFIHTDDFKIITVSSNMHGITVTSFAISLVKEREYTHNLQSSTNNMLVQDDSIFFNNNQVNFLIYLFFWEW